ncbi:MAG TPA: hypothetical protein VKP13_00215 [Nitrospira sp.]|nr:hypothetical protein [Nitrospira sp.]
MIINGNLVNRGRPRAYPNEVDRPYRDNYNFEFTRDYTGSDGLGYIQTAGFGLPVIQAQTAEGEPAWFNPRKVLVEDLTEGTCDRPRAERIRAEACVKLAEAMTASGAGLDLDSLVQEWYHDDIVTLLMSFVTAPFNVNNEYQTWNYTRRYNTTLGTSGTISEGHDPAHLARYEEPLDRNHRRLLLRQSSCSNAAQTAGCASDRRRRDPRHHLAIRLSL